MRADLSDTKAALEAIEDKLSGQFPDLDIRIRDWVTLIEERKTEEAPPGEWEVDFGADGYLWIYGPTPRIGAAEKLAGTLAAEAWEERGITVVVRATNEIWCRRSARLQAFPVTAGPIPSGPAFVPIPDSRGRDVEFYCLVDHPHEHEWGKVRPD